MIPQVNFPALLSNFVLGLFLHAGQHPQRPTAVPADARPPSPVSSESAVRVKPEPAGGPALRSRRLLLIKLVCSA
jgi:hypothetical protein